MECLGGVQWNVVSLEGIVVVLGGGGVAVVLGRESQLAVVV